MAQPHDSSPPSRPPPPTRGRRLVVSQPSWLGPPETAAVARPAATARGGRRLCSRGAPPVRCHTPPPFGAHHGQVAAGVFWGARLCHWWIFLNPAGGGGERTAPPAAAPAAPALLPPLLSFSLSLRLRRASPRCGPARSSDAAEMKVLGHRLQLLTGTAPCRSPLAALRFGAGSGRGGPGLEGALSRVRVPSGAKPEARRAGLSRERAPASGRVEPQRGPLRCPAEGAPISNPRGAPESRVFQSSLARPPRKQLWAF